MLEIPFLTKAGHSLCAANDNAPAPIETLHLPPLGQSAARTNGAAERLLFVEEGVVEVMVGGATGYALAGDFVRIPAGVTFAYRNAGNETARLVSRTADGCRGASPAA